MSNFPWQAIDPKDFIYIESQDDLTMQDVRILTKLYKPIIGNDAYSFYHSLFAELDFKANQKITSVSKLIRKLNMGLSDFYHARIRLEGLGLLEYYRSKKAAGEYIYVLNSPLTTRDFLGDPLLQSLLMEQIGKKLFQEEIEDLVIKTQPKTNYEELTQSFRDVYHFNLAQSTVSHPNEWSKDLEKKDFRPIETIENVDSFDYQFFKQGLNKHFVRSDSLTTEIKELIYTYHIIYGIDELAMQALVLESADVESGQVDKNKLTQSVQRVYLNKQKNKQTSAKLANSQKKTETSNLALSKKGFTPSEISVIKHARLATPAHYLESIKEQRNGFVTSSETWVLKELVEQSPLNKEVINIMLHYILVIQKSVVLDKNYATKIANDWAQDGVKTAEDAVEKLRNLFKDTKKRAAQASSGKGKKNYRNYYKRPAKTERLPDWAKETAKKNTQATKKLPANQDDDELQSRLENIRRQRELKEDS